VVYSIVTRILLAWSTRDPLEEFIDEVKELEFSIKKAVTKPRGRDEDINIQSGELTWIVLQAELSVLGEELKMLSSFSQGITEHLLLNKTNKRGRLQPSNRSAAQKPHSLTRDVVLASPTRILQPGVFQASVDSKPCYQ